MDQSRDTGILALALVAAACLAVYFLDMVPPTGALVDLLLSHV